jgi:hypothetical protein
LASVSQKLKISLIIIKDFLNAFSKSSNTMEAINMTWTPLKFGKHEGKTLPEVLFCDPGWFFWAAEDPIFKSKKLIAEAKGLNKKARAVLLPGPRGYDYVVEYDYRDDDNRFIDFRIVEKSKPVNQRPCKCIRKKFIDFSVVYQLDPRDDDGYEIFLETFKRYYFGDGSYQMTKRDCEHFFESEENFGLRKRSKPKPEGLFDDFLLYQECRGKTQNFEKFL